MKKIYKYLLNPKKLLVLILNLKICRFIPDKYYLKIRYRLLIGKKLNLKNPQTFNEKLQWLKLNDRNQNYTKMVDKYEAKEYVASVIGKQYIIPTYGIYDKFDDIDFEKLPNEFMIKCTHDSGGVVACKDKSKFDYIKARQIINKSLKRNYYYSGREWPYKNVKPRIIVEKFINELSNEEIKDFKFFCFDGKPEIMYVSEGLENHNTARLDFFDMDFKLSDCKRTDYKHLNSIPQKPITFEKMKEFASKLSSNIPHVRVDFYEVDGNLYFGELTFYTCSGYIPFEDDLWDKKLGDYIKI